MRLHFESMNRPRLVAKALQKALRRRGADARLADCQRTTAMLFGYASWDELAKSHACGPLALDDALAPSRAAHRRRQYVEVLAAGGLSRQTAEDIVAEIRPSDRTPPPPTPDGGLPRLEIEAFETDEAGTRLRSLGRQDLTRQVVDYIAPYRGGRPRQFPEDPPVAAVAGGLSEEARRIGYAGRLSIPGLKQAVEAFVQRLGGGEGLFSGVALFRERLDLVRAARHAADEAAEELARVRAATFSDDFGELDFVYLSHGRSSHNDYLAASDIGDCYADWKWQDYAEAHPMPRFDDPGREAWDAARRAFVETHAPPYVYATTPSRWGGVRAEDLVEYLDERDDCDLDGLLENEMTDHYEDAGLAIAAPEELAAIAEAWRKTPKRRRSLAALRRKVEAWNARQDIVSYYQDGTRILPAFPGKTRDDAVAWCESDLRAKTAAWERLHRWTPPSKAGPAKTGEAEPAPGPATP